MKTVKFTGILIVTIMMGVLFFNGTAGAQPEGNVWWRCAPDIVNPNNPVKAYVDGCHGEFFSNPISKLGIGTQNPQATLHVVGNMWIQEICDENGNNCKDLSTGWGAASNVLTTPDGQTNVVYVNSSANVGVGTTNPQSKLAVNGTITAKEVKVTTTGWSDYVFGEKYRLLSLDELETYVKREKHLPDIPSAKEVEGKGLEVADMLSKQMQKIEELTLYLIQLKKENAELKERITALEEER